MKNRHLRVADVFVAHWGKYKKARRVERNKRKAAQHILACRTQELGGHLYECDHCNRKIPLYNSCRDRHCPTCQTAAKQRWLTKRQAELLPVTYFHSVFTLPHLLNGLMASNAREVLTEFFGAVSWVLQRFAQDPQWRLSGELGFLAVLHTWSQELLDHYHLHCIIPGGVWRKAEGRWVSSSAKYLFAKESLAKALRAQMIGRLQALRQAGKLQYGGRAQGLRAQASWQQMIDKLWQVQWVAYNKPAVGGEQALDYLGRYVHRVGISDHRIVSMVKNEVTFTYRDRQDDNKEKQRTLDAMEFIRRFLLHILPPRFHKIRFYGWMSHTKRTQRLQEIREALQIDPPPPEPKETLPESILRLTGVDVTMCPKCECGRLMYVRELRPGARGP